MNIDSLTFSPDLRFANPLHVGRPNIPDREKIHRLIDGVLDRQWLTNDGPLVRELEQRFAALCETRHAIAIGNATAGLEIAIRAAGLSGEVIVPAFTFVATAHVLEWLGLQVVLCDVDPHSHCLNLHEIESLITPRTSAILGVHLWGNPCSVDALTALADKRGLHLLYDAAHAVGCRWHDRPIGSFGLAEVFSLHATKMVNSAEGGMVVTNDEDFARRVRLMRNFGFQNYDHVTSVGTNGKMNEFSAAVGLASLDDLERLIDVNRQNYQTYSAVLSSLPGLRLMAPQSPTHHNYQYVVVDVGSDCPLTRDQLLQVLHRHRVLARRYFFPGVHRMEPYFSRDPAAAHRLPVTEAVAGRVLVLPTGGNVSAADIEQIGQILKWALDREDFLRQRLPRRIPAGESLDGSA